MGGWIVAPNRDASRLLSGLGAAWGMRNASGLPIIESRKLGKPAMTEPLVGELLPVSFLEVSDWA